MQSRKETNSIKKRMENFMERKERKDKKENNIIIKGMKRKKWERL